MKEIINTKSSKKLSEFLEKNKLHKKDFAQMIGVTLSYVYNLIDNTIPFSTRGTTLERIATVMEVEPEVFDEYRLPQEPILIDDSVLKIRNILKSKKMKVVDFLKAFPRNKRLDIVDILRLLNNSLVVKLKSSYHNPFKKRTLLIKLFLKILLLAEGVTL